MPEEKKIEILKPENNSIVEENKQSILKICGTKNLEEKFCKKDETNFKNLMKIELKIIGNVKDFASDYNWIRKKENYELLWSEIGKLSQIKELVLDARFQKILI